MEINLLTLIKDLISRYVWYFFGLFFVLGVASSYIYVYFRTQKESKNVIPCVSQEPAREMVVDLSGAVKKPGMYNVPGSFRVGDLVALGGGLTEDASGLWISKNINFSKKLTDAQKVYIPFEWEIYEDSFGNVKSLFYEYPVLESSMAFTDDDTTQAGDTLKNDDNLVRVNTATLAELDALNGVGPAYAQKIIDNRPYKDFAEFSSKSTLSASLCDKLRNAISF